VTQSVFLHPGKFYFAEGPARIQTILGSCVSFTMRDPISGLAAMCHCVLPQMPEAGDTSEDVRFRYVDTSLSTLLAEFLNHGVPADRLEIKLFGGSNVLESISGERAIGSMNWRQAKRSIEQLSLSLRAHDVGGEIGRRLIFTTTTGEVLVKMLGPAPRTERHQKGRIRG
jgi:chemotaxis protein CheD